MHTHQGLICTWYKNAEAQRFLPANIGSPNQDLAHTRVERTNQAAAATICCFGSGSWSMINQLWPCFLASFFSWCSWKANPAEPTAATAATSSLIRWPCSFSGSFLALCFSCCSHIHRNTSMHTRSRAESCIDQAINKEVGFCSHQSICAGSNGAELAELLHVLVVLLLLLVVDLAGALLLLAVVEQVVVVLLLSHGSSNVSPWACQVNGARDDLFGWRNRGA